MSSNFSLSIFSYFFWRITTQRSDEKYTVQCEAVDKYLYMNHVGVLEAKSPWHWYKTHWIICLKLIIFFIVALGNGGIRIGVYNTNFPHRFFLQLWSGMLSQTPLKISQRKWIKIWKTGTLKPRLRKTTMFSLISPQVLTQKMSSTKKEIFLLVHRLQVKLPTLSQSLASRNQSNTMVRFLSSCSLCSGLHKQHVFWININAESRISKCGSFMSPTLKRL